MSSQRLNISKQSQMGSSSSRLCPDYLHEADFQPGLNDKPANLIQLYFWEYITTSFRSNLLLKVKHCKTQILHIALLFLVYYSAHIFNVNRLLFQNLISSLWEAFKSSLYDSILLDKNYECQNGKSQTCSIKLDTPFYSHKASFSHWKQPLLYSFVLQILLPHEEL